MTVGQCLLPLLLPLLPPPLFTSIVILAEEEEMRASGSLDSMLSEEGTPGCTRMHPIVDILFLVPCYLESVNRHRDATTSEQQQ